MGRLGVMLVMALLVQPAAAQTELKWKWKQDDVFWVQTATKVNQSLILEDSPALRFPADYKPPAEDRERLETLMRISRADPLVRAVLSRRVAEVLTVRAPLGAGPLVAAGLLAPFRLAWEREIRQEYEHTTFVRYRVRKRNEDGSAVLVQQLERGRTVIKPTPPGDTPDAGLDNIELVLHVDTRGVVTKVEGADKLLERAAGNDSARKKALGASLSEETLRATATQALGLFPDKPVKAGDQWLRPVDLKLGALGVVKLDRTFTFEGTRSREGVTLAGLTCTSRIADHSPAPGQQGFQLAEVRWTAGEGKTTMDVDVDSGRPLEGKSTTLLAGFLMLRNAEVAYRGRVTLEQSVTTKLFDKLPPVEKPRLPPFPRP